MLGTLDPDEKRVWKAHVPLLVHAYNATTHKGTSKSCFCLMLGRHLRLPIGVVLDLLREEPKRNYYTYIQGHRERLSEVYAIAMKEAEKT